MFPIVHTSGAKCQYHHPHVGADRCVRPPLSPQQKSGQTHRSAPTANSPNLSATIQWLKTMTTNEYIRGVKNHGWSPFTGKLWQRNYYDHIIRNEADLHRIRKYIQINPAQWELDKLHPTYKPTTAL